MLPWDSIGNLVLGVWKSHKAEKWVKAWVSLTLSALITFTFVWGTAIMTFYPKFGAVGALVMGFGSALIAVSAVILVKVRTDEQFKNIALVFPSKVDQVAEGITRDYGTTFDPNLQKKE